jgi:hypothetical protein
MRKPCAVVTLVALLAAPLASAAADHIVPAGTVDARLSETALERQRNLASIERVLASPAGARAAARAGIGVGEARRSLPLLGDQELRDLARRSATLGSDPAAGHYGEVEDLLVILLLVVLVLIVVRAAR